MGFAGRACGRARELIGVNKSRAEGLGRETAGGLVAARTKAVVSTPEHVQQCITDVLGELPVHGPSVVIFVAGNGLPDAIGCASGSPAPDVELAQGIAVGVLALRGSRINPAGPLHHFLGRPRHGHGGIARRRHLAETVGVHGEPVEDGAHVDVRSQFGAGIVGIAALVREDERVVKALLAAVQVEVDRRVHGAARLLEPYFRLIAAIVGGVHHQGIDRVVEGRSTGAIDVKMPTATSSGQEVGAIIGKIRDIGVCGVDSEGDDAVRQHDVRAVLGHGNVRSGTSASTSHIGV